MSFGAEGLASPPEREGSSRKARSSCGWSLAARAAAGAAILLGILWTQRIDGRALWGTLRRVDPALLASSAVGFLLLMATKSWRWSLLIRGAGLHYGFWPSFRSYLGAFALGILTPGRLGELARAIQLRLEVGAELGPSVRSVVSDRLFDLIFLCAFGPLALWAVIGASIGDATLVAGSLGLYVLGAFAVATAGGLFTRLRPRWRPLSFAMRALGEAGEDLVGRTGLVGSAITLLSYLVYFAASLVLLRALGISLPFRDVACVTGCLSLVLLLPISIAGIGPREATLIFLLGKYGISREDAIAYSVLQFAVFTLFGGLVGALAMIMAARVPATAPPTTHEERVPHP